MRIIICTILLFISCIVLALDLGNNTRYQDDSGNFIFIDNNKIYYSITDSLFDAPDVLSHTATFIGHGRFKIDQERKEIIVKIKNEYPEENRPTKSYYVEQDCATLKKGEFHFRCVNDLFDSLVCYFDYRISSKKFLTNYRSVYGKDLYFNFNTSIEPKDKKIYIEVYGHNALVIDISGKDRGNFLVIMKEDFQIDDFFQTDKKVIFKFEEIVKENNVKALKIQLRDNYQCVELYRCN